MNRVEGLDEALKDIDFTIAGILENAKAGFLEAGLKVLASAQKRLRASVITGNLRASGYVRTADAGATRTDARQLQHSKNEPIPSNILDELGAEVGFTAVYALGVHENLEGSRTPKFLEWAITDNRAGIGQIIRTRTGGK